MAYKLLLADDSVTIQKVVELTFTDEDFDIISVGDGITALEKIKSERPDIVLSDVIMPGMNGYELCAKVKEDEDLKRIPFLFLKGTFESFDEDKANAAGADGFIVKPFESQELIPKVKEMVESYRALGAEPVEAPVESPAPEEEIVSFLEGAGLEEAAEEPLSTVPQDMMEQDLGLDIPPAADEVEIPPAIPVDEEVSTTGEAAVPGGLLEGEETPEEDLWSEVKITDHPIPPAAPPEISFSEETAPPGPLSPEEGVPAAPFKPHGEMEFEAATLEESVESVEEEAPVAAEPFVGAEPFVEEIPVVADPIVEEPVVEKIPMGEAFTQETPPPIEPEHTEVPAEPVPPTPAVEEKILSEAEVRELLISKVEELLREVAPGIIREVTSQVLTEVAWEVFPETAEKLIQKEIDRLTGGGEA